MVLSLPYKKEERDPMYLKGEEMIMARLYGDSRQIGLSALVLIVLLGFALMPGCARRVAYDSASESVRRGNETEVMAGYEKAARLGDPKAQFNLALLYAGSTGERSSREKAAEWMEKAARADYAPAQRVLGQWRMLGIVMEKDLSEAVKWISTAAQREDDIAMYMLGRMYATGTGVEKNPQEAVRWFRLARAHGFPIPLEYLQQSGVENIKPFSKDHRADSSPVGRQSRPVSKARKELIKKVQEGLDILGYDPGVIDGIYGESTRQAVELFQEDHGMHVDGEVTEALLLKVERMRKRLVQKTGRTSTEKSTADMEKGSAYLKAQEFYDTGQYDRAITLLSQSSVCRNDYKCDMLLARAQLKKCLLLKEKGDRSYETLVQKPYDIGLKYYKKNPTLHEPYYITAMSLLINNRPSRAAKTIRRAIRLCPNNAEYFLLRGDAYHDLLRRESDRKILKDFFLKGRMAYERALEMSGGDDDFAVMVQGRLEEISATMESKRGDVGF